MIAPTGRADVAVIGGGVVGLATALELADGGASVALLTVDRRGAASRAAAGLLVSAHHDDDSGVSQFMRAARDEYASYVHTIADRSGTPVPLRLDGVLVISRSREPWMARAPEESSDCRPLTAAEVAELEPALSAQASGLLYGGDGAVDNERLVDALSAIVQRHEHIRCIHEVARSVSFTPSPCVTTATGTEVRAQHIILAAGAWSGMIAGLPRPVPVRPLRGQMISIAAAPIGHVVMTEDVYLVVRSDRTLVGATSEDVGYAAGTTDAAVGWLRRRAVETCPVLADMPILEAWSGLRPATPDLLPLLGPDPDEPRLVYACGHSRNGILLAPITARLTAAAIIGAAADIPIGQFSIARFGQKRRCE